MLRLLVLLVSPLMLASPAFAGDPPRVVAYQIVNARSIPESLTGAPGDPQRGRWLYLGAETGCAICHGMPGESAPAPGAEDAPDLTNLGGRMDTGTMRLWLVAPQVLDPETKMPAYYAVGQRKNPKDPRFGEPLLSAREIEDILAFLLDPGATR